MIAHVESMIDLLFALVTQFNINTPTFASELQEENGYIYMVEIVNVKGVLNVG